jgi:hypothetical protein
VAKGPIRPGKVFQTRAHVTERCAVNKKQARPNGGKVAQRLRN